MDFLGKKSDKTTTDVSDSQLSRERTQTNIDLLAITMSSLSDTKRMAHATGGITADPSTLKAVYDETNEHLREFCRLKQQIGDLVTDIGRVLQLDPVTVRGMTTEELLTKLDEVLPAQQTTPGHTPS